jgi:hypothetical protein
MAAAVVAPSDVIELHASIDGQPVQDLFSHREVSPTFSFTLPATDNVLQGAGLNVSGVVSPAVADGYYLMLKPLSPGRHVLNFGGTFGPGAGGLSIDFTDTITVVPKGQYDHELAAINAAASAPGSTSVSDSDEKSPLSERLKR